MAAPSAYLQQYRTLTVTCPGSICGWPGLVDVGPIDVMRYSNTGSSGTTDPQNVRGLKDSKDNVQLFLKTYRAAKTKPFPENLLPTGFSEQSIQNAYQGKGSPNAMRGTLLLYASYDVNEKSQVVSRTWSLPSALQLGLNAHCKERIGLDCLGFVVNYVRDNRSVTLTETEVGQRDMPHFTGFVAGARSLRKSLADIQSSDVIVYLIDGDLGQKARHIAVIDAVMSRPIAAVLSDVLAAPALAVAGVAGLAAKAAGKTGGASPAKDETATVRIAESYGGVGPQLSTVELVSLGDKGKYGTAFKLHRKQNDENVKVYIVPS
jgi:hypothetical protein